MLRRLALAALILPLAALADDDLARELPRLKPTEPARAPETFRLHEGFKVVPRAVEPLVTDPVAACFDEDGRLYVVEMRGYPYPEGTPAGRVRRLEDTDGDGTYETARTFLDDLSWPTGVVPADGGVFVAVAPDILFARDDDGDGVAETRKVMFTGFGKDNVQALVNGLIWGPDGWIYGASGGNGGEIRNVSNPDAPAVPVRGRDFRFKPDGSAFEAISGGGQFGHTFDDWGHRFVCNNSNHIRQIVLPARYLERNPKLIAPPAVLDIAAEGGAAPVFRISPPEPWRVVRTRQRAADPAFAKRAPATELVATGFFTSATGVTIYRGSAYPEEYRGNAFIGDVGGNLVHRKRLVADGPIFRAERADEGVEFLASTDNWFRPVNFVNTPDGTLLILDMYRETIEHPWSIPEPIKQHLDLTSGHDRGRLYELAPERFLRRSKLPLSRATNAELVSLLADPDAWWRETAQRILIERGVGRDPELAPMLRKLARGDNDASPVGRAHALWTLDVLGLLLLDDLRPAFESADANLREQAARLVEPMLTDEPEALDLLARLADDPSPRVRFQAAFSLGEAPGDAALEPLARIAAHDPANRWIRTAVLSSIAGRAPAFARRLIASEAMAPGDLTTWLAELAELIGAEGNPDATARFLSESVAGGADSDRPVAVVLGLGRGLQRSRGSLRSLLDTTAGPSLRPVFVRASALAEGTGAVTARIEAIRLMGLGPVDEALRVLPDRLDAREPSPVQLAALQALSELPDEGVGAAIVARWKALGPSLRREAIESLLARPGRTMALLDAIADGSIPAADLDPARRAQLVENPDAAIKKRARDLLAAAPAPDRVGLLSTYARRLATPGDPARGKVVFREQCATCHQAEGVGQAVGPDLATVANRPPEDLLLHILEPNREVAPAYLNYQIATIDGRVFSGLIADESAASVTLRRAEGAQDVIARDQIDAMSSTGLSLMPEGLERQVDADAMADLIAYLRGLAPAAPANP